MAAAPSQIVRVLLAVGASILAVLLAWMQYAQAPAGVADIDPVWFGARAISEGQNPYELIGPGREFNWSFLLYYPATALVAFLPLAALPQVAARFVFVGLSAALLAYAVTRRGYHLLPIFLSASFLISARAAQWAPILVAAALLPGLSWILAAKPTIGFAYLIATPSRRVLAGGVIGGCVLLAGSLFLFPAWPIYWWGQVREASYFQVPILHFGGPFLLLALFRWRRPEARLLLGMALVPQTTSLYETLPLFLVAQRRIEATILALLSQGAWLGHIWLARMNQGITTEGIPAVACRAADIEVLLMYLPALIMVMRRPNEGESPAWLIWAATLLRSRTAGMVSP